MPPPPHGRREFLRGDALAVLGAMRELPGSVVTSLPDHGKLPGLSVKSWKAWFGQAAHLVLEKLPADGVAIFYQSDIRLQIETAGAGRQTEWISKVHAAPWAVLQLAPHDPAHGRELPLQAPALPPPPGLLTPRRLQAFLVLQAALEVPGVRLLFHKICPFADEQQRGGAPAYAPGRPQYSHLLAFAGPTFVERPGAGSPDVFARGAQVWSKGMGVAAAAFAVKWLRERVPGLRVVVDPFVGEGTTLAVANHFGLDALGIDTSVKKLRKAQRLQGAWLFEADGITPVSEFRQMCWLGDDNNAGDIPGGEASPRPDNG